ncbi:MAG: hypothetical protein Q8P41_14980 [Pseudomonadota bacterium]|nr:hypothetical protein [Pseudomonadota bacterium]
MLVWGSIPYLPVQIDDTYIVFAYAHGIVERGEVAWNTGARVEGYSSALHLLAMTIGAALGADLSVLSRLFSLSCALALLGVLLGPRFGPGRAWVALAIAGWQPFEHWAVAGLETALAAVLAVLAWPLVLGSRAQWAMGTLLCVLLSLTRPEAAAWLAVALVRRLTLPRTVGRPEVAVIGGLGVLLAYHAVRASYFDAFFPTPFLVKIVAVDRWWGGLDQLGRELASAAPLLALLVLWRRSIDKWALVPLAIQAGLLVRAGGDWMGHGRFLVPGVLATAAAALAHGAPRQPARAALAAIVSLAAISFFWEPSRQGGGEAALRDRWYLRHPSAVFQAPWPTPLLDEVGFLIEHVPRNAGAFISDVGLPGNLGDIRIWDAAGLTDRVVAELIATREPTLPPALQARYDDDDDVWCMRYGLGASDEESLEPWLQARLPEVFPSTTPHLVWRCRTGGGPTASLIIERWKHLVDRFPAQEAIRWKYARALLTSGDSSSALEAASHVRWMDGSPAGWIAFGDGQDGSFSPGRGWALYANGKRLSVAAPYAFWRSHAVSLDVDDPGDEGAEVRVSWAEDCDTVVHLRVFQPMTVTPPVCDRPGLRRLIVEFLNDEARAGSDRNLYVSLRDGA